MLSVQTFPDICILGIYMHKFTPEFIRNVEFASLMF